MEELLLLERAVEALLFAAEEPLSLTDLAGRLQQGADIEAALAALTQRYAGRGVELDCVAGRYRFRTAPDLAYLMSEVREEPQRLRQMGRRYQAAARVEAYPLEAARDHLRRLLPGLSGWTPLQRIAPHGQVEGPSPASYLASTFSAGLEMTKEGALELNQMEAFCDLMLRARRPSGGTVEMKTGQAA